MDFLFDSDDEDQGNILDYSDTSSSKSENEDNNLMVNKSPLDKALEKPTPLPQDKKKAKIGKGSNKVFEDSYWWKQLWKLCSIYSKKKY